MIDGEFDPASMYYLEEYRKKKDDPLWRSTAALETMCEYILFLESKLAFNSVDNS